MSIDSRTANSVNGRGEPSGKPTLLIADDHALVGAGISRLLESHYDVVGIVPDGRELVRAVQEKDPELIVMDISMPGLNGMEAMHQLKKLKHRAMIVVVTQHSSKPYVSAAFEAGARGYVVKQSAPVELLSALNDVRAGRFYVTPSIVPGNSPATLGDEGRAEPIFRTQLTPRQREVLQLVAEGKSGKEIASALAVSLKTVEFHKARLMKQLNLFTTAELTRYAIQQGII
jgi:DNA-binding NarL/FixJ family response regulator